MDKTAIEKAISWQEENQDGGRALLVGDGKSYVDAVGNLRAPGGGIRLVQAAVVRLNAERCLGVL